VITVKLYSIFRNVIGEDELTLDLNEVTVKGLLDLLFKRYSKGFEERKYVGLNSYPSTIAICIHGKMLNLSDALNMRLKDGDEVHLLEIVAGG